jgi:hypothetical protein
MNVTTVSLEFAKRIADAAPWLDRCAETVQPRVRSVLVSLLSTLTGSQAIRNADDVALALGIASSMPASATGTSDWRDLIGEQRRIANADLTSDAVKVGQVDMVTCGSTPA